MCLCTFNTGCTVGRQSWTGEVLLMATGVRVLTPCRPLTWRQHPPPPPGKCHPRKTPFLPRSRYASEYECHVHIAPSLGFSYHELLVKPGLATGTITYQCSPVEATVFHRSSSRMPSTAVLNRPFDNWGPFRYLLYIQMKYRFSNLMEFYRITSTEA